MRYILNQRLESICIRLKIFYRLSFKYCCYKIFEKEFILLRKGNILITAFILSVAFCFSVCFADGTYTSSTAGEHALTMSGTSASYNNITVTKTGDVSGQSDDYDWQGTNAAVHASGGGTLKITGSSTKINSNAKYGNAVFSYGGNLSGSNSGDGTTIVISDAVITTSSNNSGGIMVTGGGIISADNLAITTSSGSSAAIRSDKGGGTINISGGTYTTSGTGSPAIYSTANITVYGADLKSNTAQAVVIEGGNSVTLYNDNVTANHNTRNGQDTTYQAVLIYQSMSGDASDGESSFAMTGGSITNSQGDIFCVTNTTTTITLSDVTITNNDSSGYFLRAASQSWGTSGSNGGNVTLKAVSQDISGNIIIDSASSLNMTLSDNSTYSGAITINSSSASVSATGGSAFLTVGDGCTLKLTGNSSVTSLDISDEAYVNYGDYSITVGGTAYSASHPYAGHTITDEEDTSTNDPSVNTNTNSVGNPSTSGGSSSGCNFGFGSVSILFVCLGILKNSAKK